MFAVNLKSAYLTMKQTIPLMVRQGGGSIINISSIASSATRVFPMRPITHRRPRSTNSQEPLPSNMRAGGLE